MAFPKRTAEIYPTHGGTFVCRITAGGKFVSSTVHDTMDEALAWAAKRKAAVK